MLCLSIGAYPSPINLTAIKSVHKKYSPLIIYSCPSKRLGEKLSERLKEGLGERLGESYSERFSDKWSDMLDERKDVHGWSRML